MLAFIEKDHWMPEQSFSARQIYPFLEWMPRVSMTFTVKPTIHGIYPRPQVVHLAKQQYTEMEISLL